MNRRSVLCFHCGASVDVSADAVTLQCNACGKTVDMSSYNIDSLHTRGIKTHGQVHIAVRGRYQGPKLTAGRLVVSGILDSIYECDELVLTKVGRIGAVGRQRLLTILAGTRLRLQEPVRTVEAGISGILEAPELIATGHVQVCRGGLLQANVRAGSICVEDGARFDGDLAIVPSE